MQHSATHARVLHLCAVAGTAARTDGVSAIEMLQGLRRSNEEERGEDCCECKSEFTHGSSSLVPKDHLRPPALAEPLQKYPMPAGAKHSGLGLVPRGRGMTLRWRFLLDVRRYGPSPSRQSWVALCWLLTKADLAFVGRTRR